MASLRIAALIGDYYHAADGMRGVLQRLAAGMAAELEVFTDPAAVPWDSLQDFRALAMAKENRVAPATSSEVWASPRHEAAIAEFTAAGGALIGLHNGLASYDEAGRYWDTMRGGFQFHPREHPRFAVRRLDPVHRITEGFQPFDLVDEMYFVRVQSPRTTKLLEVVHPDYGSSCAAWAHEIGKGRVFGFTPGHTVEVLNHPGYQRLLDRGLRWALRLEQAGQR